MPGRLTQQDPGGFRIRDSGNDRARGRCGLETHNGKLATATKSVVAATLLKTAERSVNVYENKGCQDSVCGTQEKHQQVARERASNPNDGEARHAHKVHGDSRIIKNCRTKQECP